MFKDLVYAGILHTKIYTQKSIFKHTLFFSYYFSFFYQLYFSTFFDCLMFGCYKQTNYTLWFVCTRQTKLFGMFVYSKTEKQTDDKK